MAELRAVTAPEDVQLAQPALANSFEALGSLRLSDVRGKATKASTSTFWLFFGITRCAAAAPPGFRCADRGP
jgi:hypothetical protein